MLQHLDAFFENEFLHKDLKFNCSLKNYKNKESKVHAEISSIDLSWEHGDLQNVALTLKKKMTEA